jgi:membrane protein DedA with SNARE-associated domain
VPVSRGGTELEGVAGWAVDLMESIGGPGAGIAIALENLFPPLPSEVILPLAGFTASRGDMSLASAIVWTTVGSLVGALVLYYLGAALGRERMRRLAVRVPLIKVEDVDKAEAWFGRHGRKAVFFGRMIPLFRSFISIPAGVERMPVPTFVLYTTAGSLIWNVIFVMSGFWLGESWHLVEGYADPLQKAVIVAVVLGVAWFVGKRLRERLVERRG